MGITYTVAKPKILMLQYVCICILGNGKRQAQLQFIQSVYELENYGMQYVRALVSDENVIIGIGAKYIRIFSLNWRCKTRLIQKLIPFLWKYQNIP